MRLLYIIFTLNCANYLVAMQHASGPYVVEKKELTYQPERLDNQCIKKIITSVAPDDSEKNYAKIGALFKDTAPKDVVKKIIVWCLTNRHSEFNVGNILSHNDAVYSDSTKKKKLLKYMFCQERFTVDDKKEVISYISHYEGISRNLVQLFRDKEYDLVREYLTEGANPSLVFNSLLRAKQSDLVALEAFLKLGGYVWLKSRPASKEILTDVCCAHAVDERFFCKINGLKMLLSYGIDTNISAFYNLSAERQTKPFWKIMIMSDCVPGFEILNKKIELPLHWAAFYHSENILKYLLQKNYKADCVSPRGYTPLQYLEMSAYATCTRAKNCKKLLKKALDK